jgi:molecular chaperone GrpE (heat shock protein)
MFQFDWQARDEDFVKWMFVHLIADNRKEDPKFEKLSEATDQFRNVKLTMQVNSIEVNAQNFIESVENAIRQYTRSAAKELINEIIPDLDELQEAVYNAQHALSKKIKNSFKSAGITWDED